MFRVADACAVALIFRLLLPRGGTVRWVVCLTGVPGRGLCGSPVRGLLRVADGCPVLPRSVENV